MAASILLPYAGLLGLVLLGLSYNVVRLRRKHQVGIGTGDVPELARGIRAHANFCEYVPLALILLFGLALAGAAPIWALHGLGAALVIGRILHAIGLSRTAGASAARVWGTLLTWIVVLFSSGAAIGAGAYSLLA